MTGLFSRSDTLQLHVEGMTTDRCERSVRQVLQGLGAVHRAVVDRNAERARVTYETGRVDVREMIRAVKEAGYDAEPR